MTAGEPAHVTVDPRRFHWFDPATGATLDA